MTVALGPPVGPGIHVPDIDEVLRAARDVPDPGDWEAIAAGIVPIFERLRPFPFDVGQPLAAVLPPGVSVGIGYDFGPAFMKVTRELAARWPVSEREIVERALANLRRRMGTGLHGLQTHRDSIDGVPFIAVRSGDGWASTLLLVPDLLETVFGSEPSLFLAPMRDLLIALPIDVDLAFATSLTEGFEALDPNALCLEGFAWRSGRLSCRPLLRRAASA